MQKKTPNETPVMGIFTEEQVIDSAKKASEDQKAVMEDGSERVGGGERWMHDFGDMFPWGIETKDAYGKRICIIDEIVDFIRKVESQERERMASDIIRSLPIKQSGSPITKTEVINLCRKAVDNQQDK